MRFSPKFFPRRNDAMRFQNQIHKIRLITLFIQYAHLLYIYLKLIFLFLFISLYIEYNLDNYMGYKKVKRYKNFKDLDHAHKITVTT